MCGRFLFSDEVQCPEVLRFSALADERFAKDSWSRGEVTPGTAYPVLVRGENKAALQLMTWGYERTDGSLLINARAESVEEKRTFASDFQLRRCAILVTGFFERGKDEERTKFLFRAEGPCMYLGAIFNTEGRYTILTTEANSSVRGIHHRMPVIVPKGKLLEWLKDVEAAREILRGQMPVLTVSAAE